MEKIMIHQSVSEASFSIDDKEYKPIDEIINELNKLKEAGCNSVYVSESYDDIRFEGNVYRIETDEEFSSRKKRDEIFTNTQEEKDRQTYERLKLKFG